MYIRNRKSIIFYLVVGLVPLIIFTYIVLTFSSSIMQKNALANADYQSEHIAAMLDNETENILNIVYDAVANTEFRRELIRFSKQDNREYMISLIRSNCEYYESLNTTITECVYVTEDDFILTQTFRNGRVHTEWDSEDFRRSAAERVKESNRLTVIESNAIESKHPNEPVFYIGVPIRNKTDIVGELFFGISESFFETASFLNTETYDSSVPEVMKEAHLQLIMPNGKVLYASDRKMIGENVSAYKDAAYYRSEEYIHKDYSVNQLGCTLESYYPKNYVYKSVKTEVYLLIGMIMVYAIVFVYFCGLLLSHQNKKIMTIAKGIENFHGYEKDYTVPNQNNESLNLIIDKFNNMARDIYELSENIENEHEKTKQAMELQRMAEVKTLEAQINPHFLYNTLDTINWMALDSNNQEISEMIGALASLLRYSVSNIDTVVLVKAEVEWLKKYLFLQEKRFGDLFSYDIQVDPEAEYLPIHKMLMQPLVENSIIHGFSDRTKGGKLTVTIEEKASSILSITIADNGCGMTAEKMAELQNCIENPHAYKGNNIGFFNVASRLHAYYKDQYELSMKSEEGKGTEIGILIYSGEETV